MQLNSYPDDVHGRSVLTIEADALEVAAGELFVSGGHFVLAIAADTRGEEGARLVDAAAGFLRRGASYVCCWGPDCSRLHDCFDEADRLVNGESSAARVLMTTWHEDEPWEEALWFALNSTVPALAYEATTRTVVAVSIANPGWAHRAQEYLASGAPMPDVA